MKLLTPGRLAAIKTPCCGVPYENTRCSKCWQNYAHDLMLLDKFMSDDIHRTAPPGYIRDEGGTLHSEKQWKKHWGVGKKVKEEPEDSHTRFIKTATKKCRRCAKEKPLMYFKSGNGFMGRQSNCLECYEKILKERVK